MPSSLARLMAGIITLCSSSPKSPPSPLCGFRLSTPIVGLSMLKSLSREAFIRRSLERIFSSVIFDGTSFKGICPVTTPSLMRSEIISMVTSFTPKLLCRNSVWPGNLNPCPDIDFLLIGPVTSTSTAPSLTSLTAVSRALIAA